MDAIDGPKRVCGLSKDKVFWSLIAMGCAYILVGAIAAGVVGSKNAQDAASSGTGSVRSSSSAAPSTTTSNPTLASSSSSSHSPTTTSAPTFTGQTYSPTTTSSPTTKAPTTTKSPITLSPTHTGAPTTPTAYPAIPPSQILVISSNVSVYVPWQYCLPENCPAGLGICDTTTNQCIFNSSYNGLASFPYAYATEYCSLTPTGCLGVSYINTPYTTASYIAGNWSLPICQDMTTPQKCIGIHASPVRFLLCAEFLPLLHLYCTLTLALFQQQQQHINKQQNSRE